MRTINEDIPVIEDGIPVSKCITGGKMTIASVLRGMKPGQSFKIAGNERIRRIRTIVAQRDFKGKFITRAIDKGVYRVWRKEDI